MCGERSEGEISAGVRLEKVGFDGSTHLYMIYETHNVTRNVVNPILVQTDGNHHQHQVD